MSKKQEKKTAEKKTAEKTGSSHKFAWFALFALVSVVGAAVWFVMNSDDI